ncbi:M48 family metallopeptidase [Alphaproteobacteria bacterium]|nr:M48 family metallopeptidase [Alphaproteobacteria bacterium]
MSIHQQLSTIIGHDDILIDIKRTLTLKKIAIKVKDKRVTIKVPFFINNNLIKQLVNRKLSWIKKKLNIQSKFLPFKKKSYVNDEKFLYLGKYYKLKILKNKKYSVNIEGDFLRVNVKDELNILKVKKLLKEWFREKSFIYFQKETLNYAKINNLKINSVKVREYKARWGSCSNNADISFNWRLIMAPPKIIEYVIIHELMHIKEHNHSPKYWNYVKSLYPNINEAKEWLMYNGQTLNI